MLDVIFGIASSAGATAAMLSAYFDMKKRKGEEISQSDLLEIRGIGLEYQANPDQNLIKAMALAPGMSNRRLEEIIGGIKDGIDDNLKDLNKHLDPRKVPNQRERDKGIVDIERDLCWQISQLEKYGGLSDADLIEVRQKLNCS